MLIILLVFFLFNHTNFLCCSEINIQKIDIKNATTIELKKERPFVPLQKEQDVHDSNYYIKKIINLPVAVLAAVIVGAYLAKLHLPKKNLKRK